MSALTNFVLAAEWPAAKPDEHGAAGAAETADALNRLYGERVVSPFVATASCAIEGTIGAGADPVSGIILATLTAGRGLRWDVGAAGAAPDREVRGIGGRAIVRTGSERTDRLVEDLLPALLDQLDDLTDRQREIARLALVDGLRQSQVAARLDVQRATVSISFERSHIASLARFAAALRRLLGDGVEA